MQRIFLFLFLVQLFCGCHLERKGVVSVVVEHAGKKLAGSKVTLFDEISNTTKEFETDNDGLVQLNVDFSKHEVLKFIVRNDSLDQLYKPQIVYVKSPNWWKEQVAKVTVLLSPIQMSKEISENTNEVENKLESEHFLLDFPSEPLSQAKSISEIENPLPEEPLFIRESKKIETSVTEKKIFQKSSQEINSTISSNFSEDKKNYLFEDKISVEVYADNKALENAQVYSGKNSSQTVQYLGSTDAKGSLSFSLPQFLRPDMLFVRKNGYNTAMKPFTPGSGKLNLRLELLAGKSTEFFLQNYAYGVGKGFDKTELFFDSAKMDVSSLLGFVNTPRSPDGNAKIILSQKNSIPQKIEGLELEKSIHYYNLINRIPVVFTSSRFPFKPSVGLVEPPFSKILEGNLVWRKVRREFFSRFMNAPHVRGIIQSDVLKMAQSVGMDVAELLKAGWKSTPFFSELDFIFQIQFLEKSIDGPDNNFVLSGKIIDKYGNKIFSIAKPVPLEEPERSAAFVYSELLNSLPVEGVVAKVEKKKIELNIGSNFGIQQNDYFIVYVAKEKHLPPDKPIGMLQVKMAYEKHSEAQIVKGDENIFANNVLRVVRYPKSFIDNESNKFFVQME